MYWTKMAIDLYYPEKAGCQRFWRKNKFMHNSHDIACFLQKADVGYAGNIDNQE